MGSIDDIRQIGERKAQGGETIVTKTVAEAMGKAVTINAQLEEVAESSSQPERSERDQLMEKESNKRTTDVKESNARTKAPAYPKAVATSSIKLELL